MVEATGTNASAPLEARVEMRAAAAGAAARTAAQPACSPRVLRADTRSTEPPDTDFSLALSPAALRLAAASLEATSTGTAAVGGTAVGSGTREPDPRDRSSRIVDAYRAVQKGPLGTRVRIVA